MIAPDIIDTGDRLYFKTEDAGRAYLEKMASRGVHITLARGPSESAELFTYGVVPYVAGWHVADLLSLIKAAMHWAALMAPSWDGEGRNADAIREILATGNSTELSFDVDDFPPIDGPPFHHTVSVIACPRTKVLIGRVVVYGILRIRIVLSYSYAGNEHGVWTRTEDPINAAAEELAEVCGHPITWLLASHYGLDEYHSRSIAYLGEHRELIRNKAVEQVWDAPHTVTPPKRHQPPDS